MYAIKEKNSGRFIRCAGQRADQRFKNEWAEGKNDRLLMKYRVAAVGNVKALNLSAKDMGHRNRYVVVRVCS